MYAEKRIESDHFREALSTGPKQFGITPRLWNACSYNKKSL